LLATDPANRPPRSATKIRSRGGENKVDPKSTIGQEEIFGPVLSIITYKDEDDAVRMDTSSLSKYLPARRGEGRATRRRAAPRR
jgi:hypothetical protein